MASAEATYVGSTLQDPSKPSSTRIQHAFAGDVNLRAQVGRVRLKADFMTRSLQYILLNVPSLVPGQDLTDGSTANPELFGSVGADVFFGERTGLTVGLTGGVQQPASFLAPKGQTIQGPLMGNTGSTLSSAAAIVVRREGDFSILPQGKDPLPLAAAKLEIREDFLEWFAAILQVYYQYDPNQTTLGKNSDGTSERFFSHPNQLGFNITLQARY
jgi:hypothetical protein